jgi:hypothetical protein
MFDPQFNNFDPKDLYDPRDPHIYAKAYPDILRQTLGAAVHDMWCEWVASMVQQNVIDPSKVEAILKLVVPFHQLPPDSQRDQMIRGERVLQEFINWKLATQKLKKADKSV